MTTQIIAIESISEENSPSIYKKDGLKPFFEHIKSQVSGEVADISTQKGRDRIKSLAMQVSKSKKAVEEPGRKYLKEIKELPKTIEKELREFVDACDALRDEIRKPVTEFEEREAARLAKHESTIKDILDITTVQYISRVDCNLLLEKISAIVLDESCEEFLHRYVAAEKQARMYIEDCIKKIDQAEEIARLQKEAELKAQQEREERIAREAKELAEREAKEREERLKREQEAALEKAKAEALERELKAKLEAENALRIAEENRIRALKLAEEEKERAIKAEIFKAELQRKEEQQAKELAEREAAKIAANKQHQKAVNNRILEKLLEIGVSEELGKAIIIAAAKNQLAALTIKY